MRRQWENLQRLVLDGVPSSKPIPQGSGICAEEEAEQL